jgi:phenylacetate-CoA ligase
MVARYRCIMDLYSPVLEKMLFPAMEAVRGRPTLPLLRFLRGSEHWALDALRDLQSGLLRRLIRHAASHTAHYRTLLADRGIAPEDIATTHELRRLPLLDRDVARNTLDARTATTPPWVVETTSVADAPIGIRYSAESRSWRDAARWRGYGWAGYRVGMRALHYLGEPPPSSGWLVRALDRAVRRDLHISCIVRSEYALAATADQLRAFAPEVIVAYAGGAAALARFVNQHGLRRWRDTPVIIAAERLWPHDRTQIEIAFGPVFETYGGREVQLIGAQCEARDGLHTAMENLIVELVVRGRDGSVRAARPGEIGEVVVTDLHNLACPLIRYVTGDLAIARGETRCACGRGLVTIGPIDGRVAAQHLDEIAVASAGKRTAGRAAARSVMLA